MAGAVKHDGPGGRKAIELPGDSGTSDPVTGVVAVEVLVKAPDEDSSDRVKCSLAFPFLDDH
jgi:hypothetical protein